MSQEEKKVKRQSKLLLKLIVIILLAVSIVEAYIIYKTRSIIKETTGEKSLVKFVEREFEKDRQSVGQLFERFMSDTSYKGKPIKQIKKEDIAKEIEPIKQKFNSWYTKKFGDSSITHSSALKGNSLVVTVSIPGVIKESVDITVLDDIIKMSGELKRGEKRTFTHSILIPAQADAASSKVDFDAGPNRIKIIFQLKA